MDPDTAAEWCGEHSSQLACCIVMDIPADTWAEDQIRQAVATLVPDHRGLILDIKKNPGTSHTHVLLEWRKGIPACFQGASVKLTGEVEVQLIQPSTPRGDHENVPDVTPTTGFPPATFFTTMGKLVETLAKNSTASPNYGYRKLRFYSGKVPVPTGEEDFETWIDQAVQAVEEWEVADTVKRQRLIESLRGPASEVIRNLKRDKPGCTAAEYLEALQEISGEWRIVPSLFTSSLTPIKRKEKNCPHMSGGWIKSSIRSFLKEAWSRVVQAKRCWIKFSKVHPLDPIMLKFQTRYQNTRLTYSKLIKAIREEEALIQAKKVANASHTVFTAEVGTLSVADAANIQTEVLALKTQMLQMMELMMSRLAEDPRTEGVAVASNRGSPRELQEGNMPTLPRKKCFGCGEIGHFRAQCPQGRVEKKPVEELLKAVEKLLSALQAGNSRGSW
uniref:CCHC-type domain-containing protein n=1 Tax=Leptobrachium leishanense TaxID=445787 RepID=A0A8C5PNH0_9ANUR